MTEQDNGFRKFQRFVRDNARSAKKKFDDSELSGQLSEKATAARNAFKDGYTKSGIGEAVKPVVGRALALSWRFRAQ